MAVTFIRDTDWKQSALVALGGGGFELDTARVPFRGRATAKKAFVDAVGKWHSLAYAGYPKMFCDSSSDDQAVAFPTVEYTYIGFRSAAPTPKAEDSLVQKTVTLIGASIPLFSTLSFQGTYKAPRTKWTWYQATRPNEVTPAISGVRGNFSMAGSVSNCFTPEGLAVAPSLAAKYLAPLKTKVTTTDYTFADVVPNAIWLCSCVSERDFSI